MPRPLRSEIYNPLEVSILHVCQRCVRRAYLAGVDDASAPIQSVPPTYCLILSLTGGRMVVTGVFNRCHPPI